MAPAAKLVPSATGRLVVQLATVPSSVAERSWPGAVTSGLMSPSRVGPRDDSMTSASCVSPAAPGLPAAPATMVFLATAPSPATEATPSHCWQGPGLHVAGSISPQFPAANTEV